MKKLEPITDKYWQICRFAPDLACEPSQDSAERGAYAHILPRHDDSECFSCAHRPKPSAALEALDRETSREAHNACHYCRGKQAWLNARFNARTGLERPIHANVGRACPHHATLDVVANYVAWVIHEPQELVCSRVKTYTGGYRWAVRLSRPIPPFGKDDPVPAQSLAIKAYAVSPFHLGDPPKIGALTLRSRKYVTSTGRGDPEFDAILRLYRAAQLLPRQEIVEDI